MAEPLISRSIAEIPDAHELALHRDELTAKLGYALRDPTSPAYGRSPPGARRELPPTPPSARARGRSAGSYPSKRFDHVLHPPGWPRWLRTIDSARLTIIGRWTRSAFRLEQHLSEGCTQKQATAPSSSSAESPEVGEGRDPGRTPKPAPRLLGAGKDGASLRPRRPVTARLQVRLPTSQVFGQHSVIHGVTGLPKRRLSRRRSPTRSFAFSGDQGALRNHSARVRGTPGAISPGIAPHPPSERGLPVRDGLLVPSRRGGDTRTLFGAEGLPEKNLLTIGRRAASSTRRVGRIRSPNILAVSSNKSRRAVYVKDVQVAPESRCPGPAPEAATGASLLAEFLEEQRADATEKKQAVGPVREDWRRQDKGRGRPGPEDSG
jgi:hypothetical protein